MTGLVVSFFVPAIWPVEMVNVLLVNERCKRITPQDTARGVTLFEELAIRTAATAAGVELHV